MVDKISSIVALIVALIGAGTTIYNVFFKGKHGRKQAYYECLLRPFVIAYKKNMGISATIFAKSKVDRDNDNIPKYIFYLIDESEKQRENMNSQQDSSNQAAENIDKELPNNDEDLKKVLLEDYISLYSNEHNKMRRVYEIVLTLLNYVMIIFVFVLTVVGSLFIVSGVLSLVSYTLSNTIGIVRIGDLELNAWQWSLLEILMGVVIPFVGAFLVRFTGRPSDDMYTTKTKVVKSMIKKKVRSYDKHHDEYVL